MKAKRLAIFLFLLSCGVFCGTTRGVEVQPTIVQMPSSPGEPFSFDLVISTDPNPLAQGFQATIGSISGPSVLTFDIPSSQTVSGETAYWVFGNSAGATAIDNSDGSYTFGDSPDNGVAEPLVIDDIMARYAFTWDGTVGDYTFTLDLDINKSFIQDESFTKQVLQFSSGQYPGDSDYFTVHIPEPTSLVLFGLGGLVLLKHRRP